MTLFPVFACLAIAANVPEAPLFIAAEKRLGTFR
jgi:hypothetical protein